jgi:hypothetical protein
MDMSDNPDLNRKIDIAIKLLAANLLQGKNMTQQALLLSSLGIGRGDIAWILGKDPDLVSRSIYQVKSRKAKKKETSNER